LVDSSRKRFGFGVPSVRSNAQQPLRGFVGRSALAKDARAIIGGENGTPAPQDDMIAKNRHKIGISRSYNAPKVRGGRPKPASVF
jgi:hypothetical protein